jgi:hypothetical protein
MPTPSPVEYALRLPAEDKARVFCALLRELIELEGGSGLIPITDADGVWLGYHVPPKAADALFETDGPKVSPERLAEVEERFRNPGPTIPAAQLIAELKAEVESLQRQRRQSAEPAVA